MTEDRMFSYVLWYTGKYRVSRARLREKLLLKGSSPESIEKILPLLDPYHSDLEEIRSTIRGVISLGKSLRMISTKLRAKGFLKLDIETILAEFTEEIGEFRKFELTISRKIEKFQ